jgi:hypothetical protein
MQAALCAPSNGMISNSKMATRKGLEPLTSGLGNRCSILLSYRAAHRAAIASASGFSQPGFASGRLR